MRKCHVYVAVNKPVVMFTEEGDRIDVNINTPSLVGSYNSLTEVNYVLLSWLEDPDTISVFVEMEEG